MTASLQRLVRKLRTTAESDQRTGPSDAELLGRFRAGNDPQASRHRGHRLSTEDEQVC